MIMYTREQLKEEVSLKDLKSMVTYLKGDPTKMETTEMIDFVLKNQKPDRTAIDAVQAADFSAQSPEMQMLRAGLLELAALVYNDAEAELSEDKQDDKVVKHDILNTLKSVATYKVSFPGTSKKTSNK